MTTTNAARGWCRRGVRGVAAIAVAGGFLAGSGGTALADPDTTAPAPSTSAAPTPAAAPQKPQAVSTATAPPPTVAVSGGAAAGTSAGSGTSTTAAQGDVLDQLAEEYAVGAGGGQLSTLLKTSLKLRSMGFKPTKPYYDEIQAAMQYRPNQNPLIAALKDTIAYQQKIRAQMEILQQSQSKNANSAVMGAGQMPAASNPGQLGPAMAPAQAPAMPAAPAAGVPAAPPAPVVPAAEAPMP